MLERKIECENCGEAYPPGWPHECESSASPTCSKTLTLDEGTLKEIATDFFRWWHNQPGANTDQGFDKWLRLNRARFGL